MATLADIKTKVRRLTRSPSLAQLTDANLLNYINTFLLYDVPQINQLFDLRRTITFYTRPYVAEYPTNEIDPNDPLYYFKDKYTTITDPVLIAGFPGIISQSRNMFYSMYPQQNYISALTTLGNGALLNFTGTLTYKPILQNNVTFSATYTDGAGMVNGMALKDVPDQILGNMMTTGTLVTPDNLGVNRGTINYVTGAYDITFPNAPDNGSAIYAETIPYTVGRPYLILYYDSTFYVRPVPDKVYPITFDADLLPTEMLLDAEEPLIQQWWQYIAYGAAKKIFEDRMDMDSVQLIMPEFLNQETLVNRKTIRQQSKQQSVTIYNQPMNYRFGFGWGNEFGQF